MKRLLHERLKNWASSSMPINDAGDDLGSASIDYIFNAIAEEIEKYYIPRPRFEDGEPVPWGSHDVCWNNGESWFFNAIGNHGDAIAVNIAATEVKGVAVMENGFVKRPEEQDTLERIEDDATKDPRHYYNEHIGHDVSLKDDAEVFEAVMKDLLRRQREVLKCDQSS